MEIPSQLNINELIEQLNERRKRDEELIKNLSVAQTFADHWDLSRHCNILVRIDGEIIHANRRLCNVLGYSFNELVGSKFMDYIHPQDKEITLEAFKDLVGKNGIIERFVNRYITKSGLPVVFMWSALTNDDIISGSAQILQACISETAMVCYCQDNNKESCYRDKEIGNNRINDIMFDSLRSRKYIQENKH